MSDETNEAANIVIAELRALAEAQRTRLDAAEVGLTKANADLERERTQHRYLQDMYAELLDKVIK